LAAHFEPDRFAQLLFERREIAVGGPHFELGVAEGAELQEEVVTAIAQLER
jgi:hypothetical protein